MQQIQVTTQGLELKLDQFSGPMDLLLHMIRENQLNIYDIPIGDITEAYLNLIRDAQRIQYEIAGEFLVMASMLLYIKSKMLLPKTSQEANPDEEEDPREALMKKLLTYEEMQRASGLLQARTLLGKHTLTREEEAVKYLKASSDEPVTILKADALDLSSTYLRLIRAFEKKILQIEEEPIDFKVFFQEIASELRIHPERVYDFSGPEWSTEKIILTILVFLELSKRGTLALIQERNFLPLCVRVLNESGMKYEAFDLEQAEQTVS